MEVGTPEPRPTFTEEFRTGFKAAAESNRKPGNWQGTYNKLPADIKAKFSDPSYSASRAVIEATLRQNNKAALPDGEVRGLAEDFEALVEKSGIDVSTEEARAALPLSELTEIYLGRIRPTTSADKTIPRTPQATKKNLVRAALLAASIAGLNMGGGISPANADVAPRPSLAAVSAELVKKIKPPSLEERVKISFEQTYLDANNNQCFRTVRLTSPETGKSIGDVLVFNDVGLPPGQFEAVCKQVFPRVDFGTENKKFVKWSTLHKADLLNNTNIASEKEKLVFVEGTENGFISFRQMDATCNLTADASIIADMLQKRGFTAPSPVAISEMLEFLNRERVSLSGEEQVSLREIQAATPQAGGAVDLGKLNTNAGDPLRNPQFADAHGVKYALEPFSENILADELGNKPTMSNIETTTRDPNFWRSKGHQLAERYMEIIKSGGHPKFIAQVSAEYSHAMPVIAVKFGDEKTPSKLYVYESANYNIQPNWEYIAGHWKLIPNTHGVVEIPLDERSIRLMGHVKNNDTISTWYWKGNPIVKYLKPV